MLIYATLKTSLTAPSFNTKMGALHVWKLFILICQLTRSFQTSLLRLTLLLSNDFCDKAEAGWIVKCTSINMTIFQSYIQGVGLSLFLFRYCLKPTIFAQNWHDWGHLEENIHPFVILDHFIQKSNKISKILKLQKYAFFQ